jgi:hypothetical protein
MTSQVLTASAQSSHSLQSVEAYIERLFQEIKDLQKQLQEVKKVSKYTSEIKQEIGKIEAEIEHKNRTILCCQKMLNFPPGSSVRNGTTTPGRVINLVIAGQIPEVHVQWHGTSFSVPESPAKLTLVDPESLRYIWNGDRYPKLIRRLDGFECDEIAILEQQLSECVADQDDPDRRLKITYLKKRIALIDKFDLDNLERAVRQGLEVFYRVGEALAEIRDRKLYKQHGFTDFRDYLREYWNMGKSKAYRLIDSAEVMTNLKSVPNCGQNLVESKSVPNWGQNYTDISRGRGDLAPRVLPKSESITRELAKLPPEQQAEAWQKAVESAPDHNPTAAHTKAVVAEIVDTGAAAFGCESSYPKRAASLDKILINDFAVGQLVQIKSDRTDKRLVGYNLSVGMVTFVNPATVNLKILGHEFNNVSPSDLLILDENKLPVICLTPSAEQYRILLARFECKEEILKAAIKQ